MTQQPDTQPGNYYVTVIRDGHKDRVRALAGPFVNDHAKALAMVATVRALAIQIDPWSAFYNFGTSRIEGYDAPGILNERLGL